MTKCGICNPIVIVKTTYCFFYLFKTKYYTLYTNDGATFWERNADMITVNAIDYDFFNCKI